MLTHWSYVFLALIGANPSILSIAFMQRKSVDTYFYYFKLALTVFWEYRRRKLICNLAGWYFWSIRLWNWGVWVSVLTYLILENAHGFNLKCGRYKHIDKDINFFWMCCEFAMNTPGEYTLGWMPLNLTDRKYCTALDFKLERKMLSQNNFHWNKKGPAQIYAWLLITWRVLRPAPRADLKMWYRWDSFP